MASLQQPLVERTRHAQVRVETQAERQWFTGRGKDARAGSQRSFGQQVRQTDPGVSPASRSHVRGVARQDEFAGGPVTVGVQHLPFRVARESRADRRRWQVR